jgi:hypothetical protein
VSEAGARCRNPEQSEGSLQRNRSNLIGSRTCKPNSVCNKNAAGRSFLWAAHCCSALATYPKVLRTEPARARRRCKLSLQLIATKIFHAEDLAAAAELPPYLVLLRVGFALPAPSLSRRCALTAPFHPYPSLAAQAVCFLWHFPSSRLEPAVPDVIRHTALRSSDFPLSCNSDRPVRLPTFRL